MIEVIPNWHPMLVHFTVALFSAAWLFQMLTLLAKHYPALQRQWTVTARWCLWLGALFTLGTVWAGWEAYNTVAHDTVSHAAMTEHRDWALVTAGLFTVLALWLAWRVRRKREESVSFLVALTVAVALLAGTAWRGGELVYRHGLGVMSLPQTGAHDHESHVHERVHGDREVAPQAEDASVRQSSGDTQVHIHEDGHEHAH